MTLKQPEPPRCPNHGNQTGKQCEPCRTWRRWHRREIYRRHKLGLIDPRHDADTVRAHLKQLRAVMTIATIVERSGVSRRTIERLLSDTNPPRQVLGPIGDALLGTRPTPAPAALIDATGTRRRLQALMAAAWPRDVIAAALGVQTDTITMWSRGRRKVIRHATAERLREFYEQHAQQPGPSPEAAVKARLHGYVDHWAWDDDTIDDPRARPYQGAPAPTRDQVRPEVVMMVVTGGRRYDDDVTTAERVEAVRFLAVKCRKGDDEIAARMAWSSAVAVSQFRSRHGIPAGVPAGRGREAA